MPAAKQFAFAMTVRTVAIDRLLEHALRLNVDAVINLGAGLDTRPYRMTLSPGLRWIEVDHPALIDYKNDRLQSESPVCTVERLGCDLGRDEERAELFSRLRALSGRAVVITEGVIPYLTREQAGQLSHDLRANPVVRYWIQDYRQGKLRPAGERRLLRKLRRTPVRFDVDKPLAFFATHGWRIREDLHILNEADRIGRPLPFVFPWSLFKIVMPRSVRESGNRTYGYVLLER